MSKEKKKYGLFFRRPLFLTLCAALAAFALSAFLSGRAKLFFFSFLLLSSLLFCFLLFLPRFRKIVVVHILCTLLLSSLPFFITYRTFDADLPDETEGHVQAVLHIDNLLSKNENGGYYIATLKEIDSGKVSHKTLVYINAENSPFENDIITANVKLSHMKNDAFAAYYLSDGILLRADIFNITSHENVGTHPLDKKETPSSLISRFFTSYTDKQTGAILSALFLGDKTNLSDDTQRDFRLLGISHLVAVSGLHLSILIFAFERIFRFCRIPKIFRFFSMTAVILIYLFIIGFPISALRAACMFFIVLLSYYFGGHYDSLTALSFVAVLFCFISPFTIYDLSFWLSVTAMAGVLMVLSKEEFHSRISENFIVPTIPEISIGEKIKKFCSFIFNFSKTSLIITFGATCATLPLVMFLNGYLSIFAPLAMIVLTPFVHILLYAALLFPLFIFIPFSSTILSGISSLMLVITKVLASVDFALVPLRSAPSKIIALLFISFFLFLKIRPFSSKVLKKALVTAVWTITSVYFIFISGNHYFQNTFVYTQEESNSSFLLSHRGENALFLFEPLDDDFVISTLKKRDCFFLDALVLNEYTNSRKRDLLRILSQIHVKKVLFKESTAHTSDIQAIQTELENRGVKTEFYGQDTVLFDLYHLTDMSTDTYDMLQVTQEDRSIVYIVPKTSNNVFSSHALSSFNQADLLIVGKTSLHKEDSMILPDSFSQLKVLINANESPIRLPKQDLNKIIYKQSPTQYVYDLNEKNSS